MKKVIKEREKNIVPKISAKCSRKELRKEKRMIKKQKKCLFFEKIRKNKVKSSLDEIVIDSDQVKSKGSCKVSNTEPSSDSSKCTKKVTFSDMKIEQENIMVPIDINVIHQEKPKELSKFQKQMQKQRKRQLLDSLKDDEKEIKTLEKRLKLNKRKNKSTSRGFVECGLDYILDVCDSDRLKSAGNTQVNFEDSDSDFFEDVSFVEGKKINNRNKSEEKNQLSSSNSKLKTLNEEPQKTEDEDTDSDESEVMPESIENTENNLPETKFWEDIYGRSRDSKGNIIKVNQEKYIPPHLRLSQTSENTIAKKQLKGLLNKLAKSNISSIANEIESIYSKHSRNSINEIIMELTLSNVVNNTLSPQSVIVDHAMLIGLLHANIGLEVGAYMLQKLVERFNVMFSEEHQVENKELDNILYLISYLFNFKLFESCLMYDILNKISNNFTEKNVDLVLVILKSVGFLLRKDDPNAMKQFLLTAQKKFNQLSAEDNSRMKYMLSILINIKNNNISKLSDFNPTQHEELKKVLKSLIRKGNTIVTLQIKLDDLLNAEKNGKWWLVGSAWKNEEGVIRKVQEKPLHEKYSAKLLALAKKQRMNTDNRRNIFCILMTAEDYQDAFEKILRLGLKGQQEREIPLVIVHCLLQEKNFNPYYGLVADQLCMSDRRHQMTLQCALWDRFRDLQSLASYQIHMLARFLAQLLIAGSLPISVLKVVEFAELDKYHIRLLRQTILSIANADNIDCVKEIFMKVSKAKKLALFREALKLFIHHFIMRNMTEGDLYKRLNMISSILVGDVS
ncbi:nucleolar MIF4G domain-containing protein 1 homolog [Halyomorpha halys]|uniref:nucleolar MIF4G domain-containing protein 1 homolog n=1 Tax=Halyomorpha halys TaxID=286706 RepID=UPI0006D4E26E|nr:nucleolar MIF4G domain-containing protein 1 homolog [Halyomorpha halys]